MDKNSLFIGIAFLLGSAYCVFDLLTKEFTPYIATGIVLFALVGLAFIKKSKSR